MGGLHGFLFVPLINYSAPQSFYQLYTNHGWLISKLLFHQLSGWSWQPIICTSLHSQLWCLFKAASTSALMIYLWPSSTYQFCGASHLDWGLSQLRRDTKLQSLILKSAASWADPGPFGLIIHGLLHGRSVLAKDDCAMLSTWPPPLWHR